MDTQLPCDLIQLFHSHPTLTALDATEVAGGYAFLKVSQNHSLLLANVGQRCGDRMPEHSGVSLKSDCMPGLRGSAQCRIVK
ncbi:hypothetical protein [Pseudomonas monteilii]|uniref:hypothetical protein n=2 Tax=Pseudomonas TaxID=286 RepID=UPI001FD50565|nr:hypothetical protein [Pseudomonas monteilii]MCJ7853088.1 hypothetical protein [Pseudomonas monteilii]